MIATAISTHNNINVTRDTVESVKSNMTDKILVVVDKVGWDVFNNKDVGAKLVQGLYHNHHCSNYRNYMFGILSLYETYPNEEWYCWVEYDVLVSSSVFKRDLELASKKKVWMLGCDLRTHEFDYPLYAKMLGEPISKSYYLLGCVHFLHHDFVAKLPDFGKRLIEETAKFHPGHFPGYQRYAFEEEMCPTIAVKWGGRLQELSCWLEDEGKWRGSSLYPVRFQPGIRKEEVPACASFIHPVKDFDNPIREHYRQVRQKMGAVCQTNGMGG